MRNNYNKDSSYNKRNRKDQFTNETVDNDGYYQELDNDIYDE